jgi:hypothetical protein
MLPQALLIEPHVPAGQVGVGQKHWLLAPQDSPFGHEQVVELPHPLVMVPHAPLGQVGVGQVHWLFAGHASPFGHVCGHPVIPPQPFGAVLQKPWHAFGSGWQHAPASQIPLFAHWIVPPDPQLTTLPQLSLAVPHARPAHGLPVGTHASAPHTPQSCVSPQLSETEPQRVLHQVGSCVQSHRLVDPSQKTPSPVPQM